MNNRLVLETYKKEGLRADVQNGFARPDQKVAVKGLVVLMDAKLSDGTLIVKGSIAYIREEKLHTETWAQKILKSDTLSVPFLIADLTSVEFIDPPPPEAA